MVKFDEADQLAAGINDGQQTALGFLHDFESGIEAGFGVQRLDHPADFPDRRLRPVPRRCENFLPPDKAPKREFVVHDGKDFLVAPQQRVGSVSQGHRVEKSGVLGQHDLPHMIVPRRLSQLGKEEFLLGSHEDEKPDDEEHQIALPDETAEHKKNGEPLSDPRGNEGGQGMAQARGEQ